MTMNFIVARNKTTRSFLCSTSGVERRRKGGGGRERERERERERATQRAPLRINKRACVFIRASRVRTRVLTRRNVQGRIRGRIRPTNGQLTLVIFRGLFIYGSRKAVHIRCISVVRPLRYRTSSEFGIR